MPKNSRSKKQKKKVEKFQNQAEKLPEHDLPDWKVMPYRTPYDKFMNAFYDPLAQKAYHYLD